MYLPGKKKPFIALRVDGLDKLHSPQNEHYVTMEPTQDYILKIYKVTATLSDFVVLS